MTWEDDLLPLLATVIWRFVWKRLKEVQIAVTFFFSPFLELLLLGASQRGCRVLLRGVVLWARVVTGLLLPKG